MSSSSHSWWACIGGWGGWSFEFKTPILLFYKDELSGCFVPYSLLDRGVIFQLGEGSKNISRIIIIICDMV